MEVWAFLPGAGHGAAYYAARPARVQGTDPRRSVAYHVGARPELGLFRRSSGVRRRRSPPNVPHNLAEEPQIPRQSHSHEGGEHPFQLADPQCLDERGLLFGGLPVGARPELGLFCRSSDRKSVV